MSWFSIDNIDTLDSPALVVYPDRVRQNIQTAIEMTGDVNRLRPHVKTHKTIQASELMLNAGIRKFKCATIAEAEMLALAGAPDVLLAYQPVGPKLIRFIYLLKQYPETLFSCLTDNEYSAGEMADAFSTADIKVSVYLDLNIGMNRTGITPGVDAVRLYEWCSKLNGINLVGLHAYDGHQRNPDISQRTRETDKDFRAVEDLRDTLMNAGLPSPILIAGGSPSFPVHAQKTDRECSPGTFVFWDHGYSIVCPEQAFFPAALVITRVISLPTSSRITVDLGHKSIAAENDIERRVYFLNAPDLKPVGQSEEHLVMDAGENHSYKIGDVFYGLPYHICPTVALYERAYTIENGLINGEWKIVARDRKLSL